MLDVLGLDQVAEDVCRAMLADRSRGVDDLCRILNLREEQVRSALDALFERSLVRRSADHADAWRAVDPQTGLQTLLARRHADLERRRAGIAVAQAEVAALIAERVADQPAAGAETQRLVGIDAVISRLEQLRDHTEQILRAPRTVYKPTSSTTHHDDTTTRARVHIRKSYPTRTPRPRPRPTPLANPRHSPTTPPPPRA